MLILYAPLPFDFLFLTYIDEFLNDSMIQIKIWCWCEEKSMQYYPNDEEKKIEINKLMITKIMYVFMMKMKYI